MTALTRLTVRLRPPWRTGQLILAARSALRLWGWPALLGMLLLIAAGVLEAWVLPRQQERAADLRQQVQATRARARVASQPLAARAAVVDPAQQFRDSFPAARWRQQRLADLFDGAARAGLSVGRTEHRPGLEPALGLARYRITLPVSGTYNQVRGFVRQALAADPALSLDSLRLSRAHAGQAQLQAQLQFSLWMQEPVPGPALATPVRVVRGASP